MKLCMENYNIIILDSMNIQNSDWEGKVAIGKSMIAKNFSLGATSDINIQSTNTNSLVIGDSNFVRNCVNYSGNTVLQKRNSIISNEIVTSNGAVICDEVLDFSKAKYELCKVSTYLSNKKSSCLIKVKNNFEYDIQQIFKDKMQFVNLNFRNTVDKYKININVDKDCYLFLTVNSDEVILKNLVVYINNNKITENNSQTIIWNINAKKIIINDIEIYGNIIAPLSNITLKNSSIFGNLYVNSVTGYGDITYGMQRDNFLKNIIEKIMIKSNHYINGYKINKSYYNDRVANQDQYINNIFVNLENNNDSMYYNLEDNKDGTNVFVSNNDKHKNKEYIESNLEFVENLNSDAIYTSLGDLDKIDKKPYTYNQNEINNIREEKEIIKSGINEVQEKYINIQTVNNNKEGVNSNKINNSLSILNEISTTQYGIANFITSNSNIMKKSIEIGSTISVLKNFNNQNVLKLKKINNIQSILLQKIEEIRDDLI